MRETKDLRQSPGRYKYLGRSQETVMVQLEKRGRARNKVSEIKEQVTFKKEGMIHED